MWEKEEVRSSAGQNHGLIDRATALSFGLTDEVIRHQVSNRRWEVVQDGVYYLNVTPHTWHTDLLAAVLAGGPEARASHRSASQLWNLDGVGGRLVEVTVPYSNRPAPQGALVHRTRRALPTTIRSSIPSTNIERTLLDLASLLPDRTLEKAYLSAIRRGHTNHDGMMLMMQENAGRGVRGTRRMRRVLASADESLSASAAEVDMSRLIRECQIPAPIQQLRIPLSDGRSAYPDFAWPDRKKIVEVDGFAAHSTPSQLRDDLERQNALMNLGWEMRRFTGRTVQRQPEIVMHQITRFVLD